MKNQNFIALITGALGAFILAMYGEWTNAMYTLLIFMAIDYISGITVAAVFKNSSKTSSGALESNVCFKGLIKKILMLVMVAVAYRIDLLLNMSYVRDAIVIAFCVNELISITENAGLMGVPMPQVIIDAIDVLKKKSEIKKE